MDIIVDIDGTLANITHRLHYIQQKPKNWDKFQSDEELKKDKVIEPVKLLVCGYSHFHNARILYCSGRIEKTRNTTEDWLVHNDLPDGVLYMRPAGDFRDDFVVKRELLAEMRKDGYNPQLVIEDRQSVIDMWKKEGIMVLAVNGGADF